MYTNMVFVDCVSFSLFNPMELRAMNYRTQIIRETMETGATYGEARNVFKAEYRRAQYLAKQAYALAARIERGAYTGTVPITIGENGPEPIAILDCPRNWTAPMIASFRELGEAICREMARDPRLAKLVTTYVQNGGPDYSQRGEYYRLRTEYGANVLK